MKGVHGRILRVDLTSRRITVDQPDEAFYRRYLGGAGFVSYFLLKEIPRGADPLSPENKLIFAGGPMTGLGMGGATRNCAGAKSPLTGGFAKSECGGFFPMDFKRTGYDALIVEGKADKPVYIWIDPEGEVDIRDASHLWGKTCLETQDAIAQEVGEQLVRTAAIGPGGENLVRFACIMNDLKDAHGRGGMGAVMGSKNLKAIAVRGRNLPEMADPDRIREMGQWLARNLFDIKTFNRGFSDYGTGAAMEAFNEVGNLPTNNFAEGYFDGTAKISPKTIAETVRVRMEGCAACPVRCKRIVEFDEPYKVDRRNGGPEYESLGALGSCCGVDDLKAVCKANELCNLYSLDTISAGVTIAFAMECFENEILTVEDTGGIELRFGNAEAMLQMVEMIARREGVGDLLAEGCRRAAEKLGRGAEEFAMHVKGLEIPMHEPRLKQGMGVIYAAEAVGADHCAGFQDTLFMEETLGFDHLRGAGAVRPVPASDLSATKVANARAAHVYAMFQDSVACCQFVPWTMSQQVDVVRAATGWQYTVHEAMKLGERVATLGRVFNIREGVTAAEDRIPERFFSGTRRGALKDVGVDREAMQSAVKTFYGMMGWDIESGIPRKEKLAELGIDWAAEYLE